MSQEVLDGQVRKAEQVTDTLVCTEPGRCYVLNGSQVVQFVSVKTDFRGGTTNEEVLHMLVHRLKILDGEFPCEENKQALTKLEEALQCFEKRAAKSAAGL